MWNAKHISVGTRFGRLIIVSEASQHVTESGKKVRMFNVQCDCGNTRTVRLIGLTEGTTRSCGCLKLELFTESVKTHGLSSSKEYRAFHHMLERCYQQTTAQFKDYGGRGITVSDDWLNGGFERFIHDMGLAPSLQHSLDRIDTNKGYSAENCRWATSKSQNRNKRCNRLITFNGETKCLAEWAELRGIKYITLLQRLKRGWNIQKALITPVRPLTF